MSFRDVYDSMPLMLDELDPVTFRPIRRGNRTKGTTAVSKKKKPRSAAQKRATKKMQAGAARKRAAAKGGKRKAGKRKPAKKPRSAAQRRATRDLVAFNKRKAGKRKGWGGTKRSRSHRAAAARQKRGQSFAQRIAGRPVAFPKTLAGWANMDPEKRMALQAERGSQLSASRAVAAWVAGGAGRNAPAFIGPQAFIGPTRAAATMRHKGILRPVVPARGQSVQLSLFGGPSSGGVPRMKLSLAKTGTRKHSGAGRRKAGNRPGPRKGKRSNPSSRKIRTGAKRSWWIIDVHTGRSLTTFIDRTTRFRAGQACKELMQEHNAKQVELSGPYRSEPTPYAPRV